MVHSSRGVSTVAAAAAQNTRRLLRQRKEKPRPCPAEQLCQHDKGPGKAAAENAIAKRTDEDRHCQRSRVDRHHHGGGPEAPLLLRLLCIFQGVLHHRSGAGHSAPAALSRAPVSSSRSVTPSARARSDRMVISG